MTQSARHILLTGATGVLGAHLMAEFLRHTDAKLHCLVRAETPAGAKERLRGFLRVYDPQGTLDAKFQSHVNPVLGDVIDPWLGLTQTEYDELADQVDLTLHGAACTNLFAPLPKIEPINIGGTRNMIRFALRTRSKRMFYVSTHTITGDKTFEAGTVFRETDHDIGQAFENMTYQYTKFVAEGLVREAETEGLRWQIARPGQIFGESTTGHYPQGQTNVSGLFYDIFRTIMDTETVFASKTHYDVTPVDYCSRAIRHLTLEREITGETYHLTNPVVTTYGEICGLVRRLGYPLREVEHDEYKRMLLGRELKVDGKEYKSATTMAFKWWFKRPGFHFKYSGVTDCRWTAELLAKQGIHCPAPDLSLIRTYVHEGVRAGFLPEPKARTRQDAHPSAFSILEAATLPVG